MLTGTLHSVKFEAHYSKTVLYPSCHCFRRGAEGKVSEIATIRRHQECDGGMVEHVVPICEDRFSVVRTKRLRSRRHLVCRACQTGNLWMEVRDVLGKDLRGPAVISSHSAAFCSLIYRKQVLHFRVLPLAAAAF